MSTHAWQEGAQRAQHCPAPMQHLQLVVALEICCIGPEVGHIIAVVAGRLPSKVLRVAVLQGPQPLGPLGAVPHAADACADVSEALSEGCCVQGEPRAPEGVFLYDIDVHYILD